MPKNLPSIFLHEKIDKKSYKMDIYKTDRKVYNDNPDKNTDPRRLTYSCTACWFLAKYQSYDIPAHLKPPVVLFFAFG